MRTPDRYQQPTSLKDLELRLADWRKTHKPPTPIPVELWQGAADVAARHGVGPVARALRLDYAALKKRVAPAAEPRSIDGPVATFMEWLAPTAGPIGECALEVETSHGARLRVHLKSVAVDGLATIIREFVR